MVDLVRLQGVRDFVQDIDHFGPRPCFLTGTLEFPGFLEPRIDPRQQLPHPERLGDVISGSQAQGTHRSFLGRHRRKHQDGDILPPVVRLDQLQDLQAVHPRHHDVQQNEVGELHLHPLQQVIAIGQ